MQKEKSGLVELESCRGHKFGKLYTSAQVRNGLEDFYNNKHGLFDGYLDFWTHVAEQFKDNQFVLGYDLMNEVYPGHAILKDTFEETTEEFDRFVLQPLY